MPWVTGLGLGDAVALSASNAAGDMPSRCGRQQDRNCLALHVREEGGGGLPSSP